MSIESRPLPKNRHRTRLAGYNYAQAGAYFLTLCVVDRNCYLGMISGEAVRLSVLGDIVREEWERTPAIRPGIVLDAFVVMPNHLHAIVILTESKEPTAAALPLAPKMTHLNEAPQVPSKDTSRSDIDLDGNAAVYDDRISGEGARLCAPTDLLPSTASLGQETDAKVPGEEIDAPDPRDEMPPEGTRLVGAHSRAPSFRNIPSPSHGHAPSHVDMPASSASDRRSYRLQRPARSLGALVAGFKASTTKRINELCGTAGMPFWQRNYYEHIVRNDADLERIRLYIADNPRRWAEDEHNLDW